MWNSLARVQLNSQSVESRWVTATEYLKGPGVLKFKATGEWEPFDGYRCGPDGTSGFQLAPERMVVVKGAAGCLIGKLGGSSASLDEAGSTVFAIGSFAVIALADKFVGPLFIGFNMDRSQRGLQVTSLDLIIEAREWPFVATPPAPQ
jgi:hypothetical protein